MFLQLILFHVTIRSSFFIVSSYEGGMMIHTALLDKAEIVKRSDGTAFARLGSGLTFQDVIPHLNKMGYMMPHGECITVGLGGYFLNNGNHPESLNYERFYNERPYLSKITGVDYDGNVFTIDKTGLTYVQPNKNIPEDVMNTRKALTETLGKKLEKGLEESGRPYPPSASSVMRLMQTYGASLMIATEFEIELIEQREPNWFIIAYPMKLVEENKDLVQELVDFTAQVEEDDLSCGLAYFTDLLPGGLDGILVKCMDWNDNGDSILEKLPEGHTEIKRVPFSAFFTWNNDSYGMGWTPHFFMEAISDFNLANGVRKWRETILTMSKSNNPCKSCMLELNIIVNKGIYTFDMMCGADIDKQNECSDFTFDMQENVVGDRSKLYKQNLPSCKANPMWEQQTVEYGSAYPIAQKLKEAWDSEMFVDFWLGINHKASDQSCEATQVQPVGATCRKYGIKAKDLVKAVKRDAKSQCRKVFKYSSVMKQNRSCAKDWKKHATGMPIVLE
mmetsp:Transcript_7969/g.7809  ORF Transcript_7969/g.7809 Transcript_7969/m.7809 type:complete len:504 (-) Transcript_7969:239-1750(-)